MLRKRFLLLFIVAAVGIGLLWIEDYTTQTTQEHNNGASQLPDYYGEGLRNRSFNQDGSMQRQFDAKSSVHYPAQKLTEFSLPKIQTVADDGETWLIQALIGIHYEKKQTLLLQQNVLISPLSNSEPSANNSDNDQSVIIRTSELTLFNQTKIAKTDKPVEVISKNGRIDAVGMLIKLDQQRVEFLSQVKAKYAP
jgi:LPS export ABC transporter protein LptC